MKTIEQYVRRPYHSVLTHDVDEDGNTGYVASVEELPGCFSQGQNPEEAVRGIFDAMAGWISVALEDGMAIPEPLEENSYRGKFVVLCSDVLRGWDVPPAERTAYNAG